MNGRGSPGGIPSPCHLPCAEEMVLRLLHPYRRDDPSLPDYPDSVIEPGYSDKTASTLSKRPELPVVRRFSVHPRSFRIRDAQLCLPSRNLKVRQILVDGDQ